MIGVVVPILLYLVTVSCGCLQYGTWTGLVVQNGAEVPLYDAYYIFQGSSLGEEWLVVPGTEGVAWGSGSGHCDGNTVYVALGMFYSSNRLTIEDGGLDGPRLKGTLKEGGTVVEWDNNSVWRLQQVKKVHVVFMNHLDVGYNGIPRTGFINNVLNVYFQDHFPRVLRLQAALRSLGYQERYLYTTHPWLVQLYLDCPQNFTLAGVSLDCPSPVQVNDFVAAVHRGDISWHAGPFNLQPENMDPTLFEYGLSISKDLDKRFGITRSFGVLSQRDVPGMTRSVIPLLVKNNVLGITVGQNQGTPPVGVPKIFRWREPTTKTEVIAMDHPFGYGGILRSDDPIVANGVALAYSFRTDNSGPPVSIKEILDVYSSLRGSFPGAEIVASTYEKFVEDILPAKDTLPVVDFEIGDVWIDGISSDPVKEIQFREISRIRAECINSKRCDPNDPVIKKFSFYLIKIPEHTWGLPGVYDSANWSNSLFEKARGGQNYKNCEAAWTEQREFNQLAINALGNHPLASEIQKKLSLLVPKVPSTSGMNLTSLVAPLVCGNSTLQFDGTMGSIVKFWDGKTEWADPQSTLGRLVYTSFNETDFDYMSSYYGGNAGYSKYNSTCSDPGCPNPIDQRWYSKMTQLWWNSKNCTGVVFLQSNSVAHKNYGAPEESYLLFSLTPTHTGATLNLTLTLRNKTPTRLPEQMMLEFRPLGSHNWGMDKLGLWVSPYDVGLNGSQYQHAVWSGLQASAPSPGSHVTILTPDAPLVSPITTEPAFHGWLGTPTVMPVPTAPFKDSAKVVGFGVNLWNNVWDTNYILWYPYLAGDENLMFRFSVVTSNS